jgi:hypothetical protein
MASQNPSSVPTVLPNALQPLANYSNNNTSIWALNGAGGAVPIIPATTYRTTVVLEGGANDTAQALNTTDPLMFPPNTSYYFNMVGTFSSEGTSTCDTTLGQLSATGLFSILNSGALGFISGSAVNTSPVGITNPGDFYLNATSTGIDIVTTSASEFTGCTFQFVWTQVSFA